MELEYRAYWVVKKLNLDMKIVGPNRFSTGGVLEWSIWEHKNLQKVNQNVAWEEDFQERIQA